MPSNDSLADGYAQVMVGGGGGGTPPSITWASAVGAANHRLEEALPSRRPALSPQKPPGPRPLGHHAHLAAAATATATATTVNRPDGGALAMSTTAPGIHHLDALTVAAELQLPFRLLSPDTDLQQAPLRAAATVSVSENGAVQTVAVAASLLSADRHAAPRPDRAGDPHSGEPDGPEQPPVDGLGGQDDVCFVSSADTMRRMFTLPFAAGSVRDLTTWTILQNLGPNHLGLRCDALSGHRMALITSGLCAYSRCRSFCTESATCL